VSNIVQQGVNQRVWRLIDLWAVKSDVHIMCLFNFPSKISYITIRTNNYYLTLYCT